MIFGIFSFLFFTASASKRKLMIVIAKSQSKPGIQADAGHTSGGTQ
jgi:hypothetical protein